MKSFSIVFTVLSAISLLAALAIFIAGSSIFIFIQLYQYILERGNFLAALLVTLPTIYLFSYGFLALIKKMFLVSWSKETVAKKFGLTGKFFLSFLFYEITKRLIRGKRREACH